MFWIPIDRTKAVPLIRQIYDQIRIRILHGELAAGERLPSTRELSSSLGISRNVVIEAYDQLFVEGYVDGKKGPDTYIAKRAYLEAIDQTEARSAFDIYQSENKPND